MTQILKSCTYQLPNPGVRTQGWFPFSGFPLSPFVAPLKFVNSILSEESLAVARKPRDAAFYLPA